MKIRRNNQGSALIVVLCVMAFAVALSLTLLLTASALVTNAARSNNREQCRIAAVSVSDLLADEITKNIRYDGAGESGIRPDSQAEGKATSLKGRLKTVCTSAWYAYQQSQGTIANLRTDSFTYQLTEGTIPGKTTVRLYWNDEIEDGLQISDGSEPEEVMESFEDSVVLYVEVTNSLGNESCTVISMFKPYFDKNTEVNAEGWHPWSWHYEGHKWEG